MPGPEEAGRHVSCLVHDRSSGQAEPALWPAVSLEVILAVQVLLDQHAQTQVMPPLVPMKPWLGNHPPPPEQCLLKG